MTFQRIITQHPSPAIGRGVPCGTKDMWSVFRELRNGASALRLKPSVLQTLSALLSCLKPGKGLICYASNRELQRRLGGISDKTVRRHIAELATANVLRRQDSPNGKRYPTRDPEGDVEAYGIDLSPMLENSAVWAQAAEHVEREAATVRHLRTKLLARLAWLDEANGGDTCHSGINTSAIRTTLRRVTLTSTEIADMLEQIESCLEAAVPTEQPPCPSPEDGIAPDSSRQLSGCGGQYVRHLSMSETKDQDKDSDDLANGSTELDRRLLGKLTSACPSALEMALEPPRSWHCLERLAHTLAPFVGIDHALQQLAWTRLGARKASLAVLVMVQLQPRIRNMQAYFRSLISGRRSADFDPALLVDRMAR